MDRLSIVIVALACAGVLACDGGDEPVKSGGSRVDVVAAKGPNVDIPGFCDVHPDGASAKTMEFPELDGAKPGKTDGWRWINVWATWCKPCIEELPMLARLRGRFDGDHLPLELVFLSVDAAASDVDSYRAAHPGTPEGPRIKDANGLAAWLQRIGLDENSALPIHLFVDGDGKIRCVRMGAVSEKDYDTVRGLVRAG